MFVRRVWPSSGGAAYDLDPGRLLRGFERVLDAITRPGGFGEPSAGVFPALNVSRDAGHFYIRAELPGVKAEHLEISTQGNKLSISGRREIGPENKDVSYHRRERGAGSFARSISLPGEFDSARVEARYADGILTITLPIAEAMKARQIKVKTS